MGEPFNPVTIVRILNLSLFDRGLFCSCKQEWRSFIETVQCPAPQPEDYSRDDDPGYHEDPDLSIELEDGVFYQEGLDGTKVAIIADYPGSFPSPATSKKKKTSRKRQVSSANPNTPAPTPKRRRSARHTPAAAAAPGLENNQDPANEPATGASAPTSSSQRYFA
jgi:hypothetical protein